MDSYKRVANLYDSVVGDRSAEHRRFLKLIRKYHPRGRKLLDIACGTGSLLKFLSARYGVAGLDLSKAMLSEARKKVPSARLFARDMKSFRLPDRFDIVVSAFDSINHLKSFKDWCSCFRSVRTHLNPNGIFLFDMNTVGKLKRLSKAGSWGEYVGADLFVLTTVTKTGPLRFEWHIQIFKHSKRKSFQKLAETKIPEVSAPLARIKAELKKLFATVTLLNEKGHPATMRDERVYFVCQVA